MQRATFGRRYISASAGGLLIAGLLDQVAGTRTPSNLSSVSSSDARLTKLLAAGAMSSNYARLARKLAGKLAVRGQLVGLAVDSEPRLYNGFRFSDAGFVSFEGGRFCYRSERTMIRLNPADVVDVRMVAASPSSWRRLQPMVRFREPESGDLSAFILHPVEWGATPSRLFQSIEQWRTTEVSSEGTSISGLTATAGQPFHVPTIAETMRGFRIPGGVTLVGATLAGWFFRGESWTAWFALIITAASYLFMYLPAMLYRPANQGRASESRNAAIS